MSAPSFANSLSAALRNPAAGLRALDALDAADSLEEYIVQGWHILEPKRRFVRGAHITRLCEHLEAVTKGQITRLLINVPPGFTKPVSIDELVATRRGRVRLGDIVIGDEVLTHRGRYRRVLAVHEQGELATVCVDTWCGRSAIVAPDHPFLTPCGWLPAGTLTDRDVVAAVVPELPPGIAIDARLARFLGYLVGDGSVKYRWTTFTNADEDALTDFEHCAVQLGFAATRRPKPKPRCKATTIDVTAHGTPALSAFLKHHDLRGKDSYTKRIPAAVMNADATTRSNFIGAYWTCDGSVGIRHTGGKKAYLATLTTVSRGLAYDLQHLMLSIGISTRVRRRTVKKRTKRQGAVYVSYQVQATDQHNVWRIARLAGLCDRKRAAIADATPRGFDSPLRADPVLSVTPAGTHRCRCLTVDEDASFTVNDIAVHNSMTTDVFWPSWEWGPKNLPSMRYLSFSYTLNNTLRDNRRTRNLIQSAWYQERWGHRFHFTSDQNQKVKFENNATGWKQASSVGGYGMGERADRLIVDDPNNVKKGESKADRQEKLLWFAEVVPTRLNDPEKSAIVVIMQRVHEEDVSGLIIAEELGYEHLMIPMRFELERRSYTSVPHGLPRRMRYLKSNQSWRLDGQPPETIDENIRKEYEDATPRTVYAQDMREDEGELAWPERFPLEVVERDEKVLQSVGGSYAVAGQFQQRPAPRRGGMFQLEWLPIVDAAPAHADRIRYWDKAGTQGGGAYSAGARLAFADGITYIEDITRGQWSSGTRNQVILDTAASDGVDVDIWIEQEPGSGGKESAEISVQQLGRYTVRIDRPHDDKATRAGPLAAQAEAGNVRLVRGKWNKAFRDEATVFPNSKFKDQVDAASGAHNKGATARDRAVQRKVRGV